MPIGPATLCLQSTLSFSNRSERDRINVAISIRLSLVRMHVRLVHCTRTWQALTVRGPCDVFQMFVICTYAWAICLTVDGIGRSLIDIAKL